MDCFSVVAGLRLPIARNFLVLTAYGKHRECVIGLDLVISVSITRVRTPYIVIFEDFWFAVLMRVSVNSSLRLYLCSFVVSKGSGLWCEAHIVPMYLFLFVSVSELWCVWRLIGRLRGDASVSDFRIAILSFEHALVLFLFDSLRRRQHTRPIADISQFHGGFTYKLFLPVYLLKQLMSFSLRLLSILVKIFLVFLELYSPIGTLVTKVLILRLYF